MENGIFQILGPPDLVVEILSPSTEMIDKKVKLKKYRESGVQEYWIVDLESKEVFVYRFTDTKFDVLPRRYTFQEKVPVGIFHGECEVDFDNIKQPREHQREGEKYWMNSHDCFIIMGGIPAGRYRRASYEKVCVTVSVTRV